MAKPLTWQEMTAAELRGARAREHDARARAKTARQSAEAWGQVAASLESVLEKRKALPVGEALPECQHTAVLSSRGKAVCMDCGRQSDG